MVSTTDILRPPSATTTERDTDLTSVPNGSVISNSTTANLNVTFDGGTTWEYITTSLISSLTPGSVLFSDSTGNISEDNSNLFFDDTEDALSIGSTNNSFNIGGDPIAFTFVVEGGTSPHEGVAILSHNNTAAVPVNVLLMRSRGTTASPTTVVDGDSVADFQFAAYDGTNYQNGPLLRVSVDGTVSGGTVPQKFRLVNAGSFLDIFGNGDITINAQLNEFTLESAAIHLGGSGSDYDIPPNRTGAVDDGMLVYDSGTNSYDHGGIGGSATLQTAYDNNNVVDLANTTPVRITVPLAFTTGSEFEIFDTDPDVNDYIWRSNHSTKSIESNYNLLHEGGFGVGATLSPSGAGVRMIFYARKAAFRSGSVSGTEWDDANVGNYSVALGQNVEASGANSASYGLDMDVSGARSNGINLTTSAKAISASGAFGVFSDSSFIESASHVIGDPTDNVTFTSTGWTLNGTAKKLKNIAVYAGEFLPSTGNPPTVILNGYAGTRSFNSTGDNSISATMGIPTNYESATDLSFHVVWLPSNTDTGNVLWELQFAIVTPGGDTLPGSPTTLTVLDAGSGTINDVLNTAAMTVSGTGVVGGDELVFTISRLGSDGTDTFTGNARLLLCKAEYTSDRYGK